MVRDTCSVIRDSLHSSDSLIRRFADSPPQRIHQQQRPQVGDGREGAPDQREVLVLCQVATDGVEGLKSRRKSQGGAAEPGPAGLRRVRNEGEQVERKVPVGVVTRLAGEITVAGRPAERVDRRARRVQRRGQIAGPAQRIRHPDDETLVGMDVLILIPVDPRKAQERRATKDHDDQRQEDEPAHAFLAAGELLTHHASRITHHVSRLTHHSSGESKVAGSGVGSPAGAGCALAS